MQKVNGSITVFSLLSILLITATLFSLLEGTRFQEMRRFAQLQTKSSLEAAFANYNSFLWKNYHLLGTSLSDMEETVERCAKGRMGEGVNLLRLQPKEISQDAYTRLTDAEGKVFVTCVSAYMQDNFLFESAKELYSQYEAMKSLMDVSEMELSNIDDALEQVKDMETAEEQKEVRTVTPSKEKTVDVLSILETAKNWKEKGILELVLEDTSQLSDRKQDFSQSLLVRELKKGKEINVSKVEWQDRFFLQQYLLHYMSNYSNPQENRALCYELEYLLAEKSSDLENLKAAVGKLLAVREAVNFLYLFSNPEKSIKAEEIAMVFVGTSANPVLIQAVKLGLLTAWAFAESILDVRTLLKGKKIALLKNEETWTTELENLTTLMDGFALAKDAPEGLSYEGYLGILLFFEKEQVLGMRAMNLQECAIRKNYNDASFCLDNLVIEADISITYSYEMVFPFLHVLNIGGNGKHEVKTRETYGYYGKAGIEG